MKGRVSTVRRSAAAAGLSLTMLVAAGTGAGAATKVSLTNYTAGATSQTLQVSLQFPALAGLNNIIQGVDLSNINERISFANSTGQWTGAAKTLKGSAEGQVFAGSLNGLISTVLGVSPDTLKATKSFRSGANEPSMDRGQTIREIALPSSTDPIVRLGIATTKTTSKTAADFASSTAHSDLASLDVRLAALKNVTALTDGLKNLEQTLNGNGGLIDQINNAVDSATGGALKNVVPQLQDLTTASILHVGVMESDAVTGTQNLAHALSNGATSYRTAHAMNRLAGVSILGDLVKVQVIELTADARLDNLAGNASATPVTRILGLQVGKNNVLDLTTGKITLPTGTVIDMPTNVSNLLNNLVVKVAGIDIEALRNTREVSKGHAFAQANSLKISVAPQITDPSGKSSALFSLTLQGPIAQAGVDAANGTSVLGRKLTKTGLNDSAFLIVGPMLFGLAILVRRFGLSH